MSDRLKVVEKAAELTQTDSFRFHVVKDKKPALTDSKLGGMPYWDKAKEYPLSSDGEKMLLLAQINFADIPQNDIFPAQGLLQFFVTCNDSYGAEFSDPDAQTNHRVIYHPVIDNAITAESLSDLQIPFIGDGVDKEMPFYNEMAIAFTKEKISMGMEDYRYIDKLREAAALIGEPVPEEKDPYDYLEKGALYKKVDSPLGHRLLGYPFFMQEDPRRFAKDYQIYDTMLLQIDSDYDGEEEYEISWGDSGVANFFIESEALKRHDFSKILYTWDCG